jgi:putative hydrolase of the HAD superfamily
MALRAVVFDWGGTLTPWHDIDLVAQWYAYAEVYDPEHASGLAHRLAEAEISRWAAQRDSHGAQSAGALNQLFLDEGVDITSARHLRALGNYLDFWDPHTLADPQARPVFQELRRRGLHIGVLSNTMWPSSHHREVFERDDLQELIDVAFYTSEMSVAKPHAEAFSTVAAALNVDPADAVYVGDRIWDDVAGAQRVGMRTIWIPHSQVPVDQIPDDSARPDAIAHELSDIPGILDAWQIDARV